MAKYSPLAFEINLRDEGFIFDVGSLFELLAHLHDGRNARGIRYALTTILVFVVLAKFAGMDSLRAIAQWIKAHREDLATWLGLAQVRVLHATTLSRIRAFDYERREAIEVVEFERVIGTLFTNLPEGGSRVHLILDGKTIRGTIPAGRTHGVHLLACYVPDEGWVWLQVAVSEVENEIPAALRLVKTLDLRGKIVSGDALLAQRALSSEIVKRKGEYLWLIKDNQPKTLAAIQELFAPEPCVPGFSPASYDDFQIVETIDKGHGRIEKRVLTVIWVFESEGSLSISIDVNGDYERAEPWGTGTSAACLCKAAVLRGNSSSAICQEQGCNHWVFLYPLCITHCAWGFEHCTLRILCH